MMKSHWTVWNMVLLAVTLVLNPVRTTEEHLSRCWWKVEATETANPYHVVQAVNVLKPEQPLNSSMESDVFHLTAHGQEDSAVFPYFLRVRVVCGETDMWDTPRKLAMTGFTPNVMTSLGPKDKQLHYTGLIQNFYEGQLVDLKNTSASSTCDCLLCEPAWLVPLATTGLEHHIPVSVNKPGMEQYVTPLRTLLYLDTLSQQAQLNASNLDTVFQELASGRTFPLPYLPHLSSSMALGGFTHQNIIIISNDEFRNYVSLKALNDSFDSSMMSVTSLRESYLLLTSTALYQMPVNGSPNLSVVTTLNKPLKKVILPSQTRAYSIHVLLLGTGQEEGKIFIAPLKKKSDELEFSELVDMHGKHPCDMYPTADYDNCTVIDATLAADLDNTISVLLYLTKSPNQLGFYALVSLSAASALQYEWQSLIEFPNDLSRAQDYSTTCRFPVISSGEDFEIRLSGLTSAGHVSRHLFMWGNVIIHSVDGGHSLQMLKGFPITSNITLLTVADDGRFAFLTDSGEIWYGTTGTKTVTKLYPSQQWEVVKSLQQTSQQQGVTFSLFYSYFGELVQLIAVEDQQDGILRKVIPVDDVLSLMAYENAVKDALIDLDAPGHSEDVVIHKHTCPVSSITFEIPGFQKYTRTEKFSWTPPMVDSTLDIHSQPSRLSYQALVNKLLKKKQRSGYLLKYRDEIAEWKSSGEFAMGEDFDQYLYVNHYLRHGIHFRLDRQGKMYDENIPHDVLPSLIYLERYQTFSFKIDLALNMDEINGIVHSNFEINQLHLSVEVTNSSLIQVDAQRQFFHFNDTVQYRISVTDLGSIQEQHPPGHSLVPTTVLFRLWQSDFQCFKQDWDGTQKGEGLYAITVELGCPPKVHLAFDINATLDKLKESLEQPYDCTTPDPDMPCVYFSNGFLPYFRVVDPVIGKHWVFKGQYTLKVVGGSEESIDKIQLFSDEEIAKYNSAKNTTATLIWGPMEDSVVDEEGYPVYTHLTNGISFFCQTFSPCANIIPAFMQSPEYYFLVEISNKGVDINSSYCDFTSRFVLRVHGIPIDFRVSLALIISSLFGFVLYIFCYFIFTRDDHRIPKSIQARWAVFKERSKRVKPLGIDKRLIYGSDPLVTARDEGSQADSSNPSSFLSVWNRRESSQVLEGQGNMSTPEVVVFTASNVDGAMAEVDGEVSDAQCMQQDDNTSSTAAAEKLGSNDLDWEVTEAIEMETGDVTLYQRPTV